ncbi:MAG TPA: hypothetical protein DCR93_39035 [Cytophagales bacterium]|nr:hypothetical protein [Cytophagales bacterium]HAP65228.1 hypothetical protein [Cytophagales bacterium]
MTVMQFYEAALSTSARTQELLLGLLYSLVSNNNPSLESSSSLPKQFILIPMTHLTVLKHGNALRQAQETPNHNKGKL